MKIPHFINTHDAVKFVKDNWIVGKTNQKAIKALKSKRIEILKVADKLYEEWLKTKDTDIRQEYNNPTTKLGQI